jgi:hypothetical protein
LRGNRSNLLARDPAANVSAERVGDLLELDPASWLGTNQEVA